MAKQRPSIRGAARATAPRATTGDDAAAFRAAVRDVKPLKHAPRAAGHGAATRPQKPAADGKTGSRARLRHAVDAPNLDESMPLIDEPAGGIGMSGGDSVSYQRAGVRTQVMRRLKRGLMPIEDELDLHGLTQHGARDRLGEFLALGRAAGLRCVRVIHGKGYRSGARGPILKIAVDQWLRRHGDVLAFTSARPIDGGTGAVYVLLRG